MGHGAFVASDVKKGVVAGLDFSASDTLLPRCSDFYFLDTLLSTSSILLSFNSSSGFCCFLLLRQLGRIPAAAQGAD
jgi:hypothetical protein